MFRSLHILLVLTMLAMIAGCEDSLVDPNTNDPFGTLPTDSIIGPLAPIDSRVFFSFMDHIKPTCRTVSLFFCTERIYGMSGYRIISSLSRTDNRISVQLDGIVAPELGAGIMVPATASFDLGALPNDLYTMNIVMNGVTVVAMVLLSDTSLITRIQPNNLVETASPRLLRVPRNTIWGQAESIAPSVYQLFLDSLVVLGATPAALLAGEYKYFSINQDGSFSIPSALGFQYGRHFLYQFDPDTIVSRSLVKRFAKHYQDSVYVQLSGGRGEMYYTTVLKWEP